MWTFIQQTGYLLDAAGQLFYQGYSGNGDGKNNPAMQAVPNIGPLPCGSYIIGEPEDSPRTGPYTLPLISDPANEMFGRSLFRIHGDNIAAPGTASDGCIVVNQPYRTQIWESGDHQLSVVASLAFQILVDPELGT
jgi:hypothetical protein